MGDPSRELPWKYREPHVREIRLFYHANSSLLLVVPGCLCNRNTLVSDPAPGNMTALAGRGSGTWKLAGAGPVSKTSNFRSDPTRTALMLLDGIQWR
jgi:hypothetical protein